MIDVSTLQTVLQLHEKTFALLRWVGGQLRHGSLDWSRDHADMSAGEAAEDWLRRNLHNLPGDARPGEEELRAFARLFASYLQTSFEIVRPEHGRRLSSCGCDCCFCSYLSSAPYLKPRSLSKKARATAMELKRLYLQELARDTGVSVNPERGAELTFGQSPLTRELALAAYAKELIRRTEFMTQGEGVYALWREFAWKDGHPDRGFRLTAKAIAQAQNNLLAALTDRLA
jgi:hypothetical protein